MQTQINEITETQEDMIKKVDECMEAKDVMRELVNKCQTDFDDMNLKLKAQLKISSKHPMNELSQDIMDLIHTAC
jgi:hypothetical protein